MINEQQKTKGLCVSCIDCHQFAEVFALKILHTSTPLWVESLFAFSRYQRVAKIWVHKVVRRTCGFLAGILLFVLVSFHQMNTTMEKYSTTQHHTILHWKGKVVLQSCVCVKSSSMLMLFQLCVWKSYWEETAGNITTSLLTKFTMDATNGWLISQKIFHLRCKKFIWLEI